MSDWEGQVDRRTKRESKERDILSTGFTMGLEIPRNQPE